MIVVKRFTFEAAHQLPNHNGKCRDLHGHSYVVEVGVEGPVIVTAGRPDEGMVIDFGDISAAFRKRIFDVCDHKFLNDVLSELAVTTAELIADWILREMRDELGLDHEWREGLNVPTVAFVRVYETATSYAEAR